MAERAGANPRATNAEIYKLIYDDLTQAIADLEGFQRTSKAAARFMFRTAASCMTFFLSMVRDHSFGRYFFSSNGVTCLRYSSHS